jgi:CRP/FNR family transcriptional regulator, cyclic AMP receptor protein
MRRFDVLEGVGLFAALPDDARSIVASVASRQRFKQGERVIEEGAVSDRFYVIASGTADVRSGGDLIATLGPGDFFGEMAALPHDGPRWARRTATVEAASRLTVLTIGDGDLRRLIDAIPELGARLRAAAAERALENRVRAAGRP